MIPLEQAALAEALLARGLTTNSEVQAMRWAAEIIARLAGAGFQIEMRDDHPLAIVARETAPIEC